MKETAEMAQAEVLTPEWWVNRLYSQLMERNRRTELFADYYKGKFWLPWLPEQAEDEFKRILHMTRSNYMGLVVDAMVERMNLIGFRRAGNKDGTADPELWEMWTYNSLDSFYDQGLLEAAIHGQFYFLVAPNPDDTDNPFITVEHPTQCIVEFEPGSNRRRRAAGLKAFIDEWTGMVFATVYSKNWIYKFQAKDPQSLLDASGTTSQLPGERNLIQMGTNWEQRIVKGEDWPARNRLGEVPLIESPNNPRLLDGGVSEIADLCTIQDRICKTLADRLMTQDYGAFPQRWASAWPKEDQQGNANQPIEVGRTRLLTTDIQETRFGQFDVAPLDPYSAAKREDVVDIASRSRTPAHYLIAGLTNVNGETLKASESGLVSKVWQRIAGHNDPATDTMRLASKARGKEIPLTERLEPMWQNPEFRTQAETTDALIKMRQALELPIVVGWEKWGATPTEIARWQELRDEEKKQALENDPAMLLAEQYRKMGMDAPGTAPGAPQPSGQAQKNGNPPPGGGRAASDPQKVNQPNGLTR